MDLHRYAPYKCRLSSDSYKRFYNLRWHDEDRQTRLKALKNEGLVDVDAVMGFEMFFEEDSSPNAKVFFLEAALKEVVYVHVVSPYPRLCKGQFDIQSAGDIKKMSDEHFDHGMMHSPRYSAAIREVGKTDNFWSVYGKDALVTVLEEGECMHGECATGEMLEQERVMALIQKRRKKTAPTGTPRATMSSDIVAPPLVAKKKDQPWESEPFIPCMRFAEESWRDHHDDVEESEKLYTEVREARRKVVDGKVVRKKDRVLHEGMTLKVTNWKDLVEEDETHFAMLMHRHSWS